MIDEALVDLFEVRAVRGVEAVLVRPAAAAADPGMGASPADCASRSAGTEATTVMSGFSSPLIDVRVVIRQIVARRLREQILGDRRDDRRLRTEALAVHGPR